MTLRQVDLGSTNTEFGVDVRGLSVLDVHRSWLSASVGVARLDESSTASFVDTSFRGSGGDLDACIDGLDTKLSFERVLVAGCVGYAIRLSGSASALRVEDYQTLIAGSFDIGARPPIVIRRVQMLGSGIVRILVDGTGAPWDLELSDVAIRGGALRIRDQGRARVERLHVADGVGVGLLIERADAPLLVEASDVRIEGVSVAPGCQSRGCSGAAVLTQASVTIDRFHFANNPGPGLQVQSSGSSCALRNGVIADQPTGVALYGSPKDLKPLLEGVALRNVSQVCDPCGEASAP